MIDFPFDLYCSAAPGERLSQLAAIATNKWKTLDNFILSTTFWESVSSSKLLWKKELYKNFRTNFKTSFWWEYF